MGPKSLLRKFFEEKEKKHLRIQVQHNISGTRNRLLQHTNATLKNHSQVDRIDLDRHFNIKMYINYSAFVLTWSFFEHLPGGSGGNFMSSASMFCTLLDRVAIKGMIQHFTSVSLFGIHIFKNLYILVLINAGIIVELCLLLNKNVSFIGLHLDGFILSNPHVYMKKIFLQSLLFINFLLILPFMVFL